MFTGRWSVDLACSTSQQALLRAMGKPSWQISLVDKAREDFLLLEYTSETAQPCFEKDVRMFLDSDFLAFISALIHVPVNEISYRHVFRVQEHKQHWPEDSKGFGDCESLTTFPSPDCFIIRWYLKCGVMKAVHTVSGDTFTMQITLTTKSGQTSATKLYRRAPLSAQDLKRIADLKETATARR